MRSSYDILHTRVPFSVGEWVSLSLRENNGDREKAIEWVHSIWGDNPGAAKLHALANVIKFLAEEPIATDDNLRDDSDGC